MDKAEVFKLVRVCIKIKRTPLPDIETLGNEFFKVKITCSHPVDNEKIVMQKCIGGEKT